MKLSSVRDILDAKTLWGEDLLDKQVCAACGADLMSDVLAIVHAETLLLTGLCTNQVIRTAEMLDVTAICFVRNKMPGADILEMADETGIVIFTTHLTLYEACGRLYEEGLPAVQGEGGAYD